MSTSRVDIADALLDVVSASQSSTTVIALSAERFGATAVVPLGVAEGTDYTELLCGVAMITSSCVALVASALRIDRDEVIFELRQCLSNAQTG